MKARMAAMVKTRPLLSLCAWSFSNSTRNLLQSNSHRGPWWWQIHNHTSPSAGGNSVPSPRSTQGIVYDCLSIVEIRAAANGGRVDDTALLLSPKKPFTPASRSSLPASKRQAERVGALRLWLTSDCLTLLLSTLLFHVHRKFFSLCQPVLWECLS